MNHRNIGITVFAVYLYLMLDRNLNECIRGINHADIIFHTANYDSSFAVSIVPNMVSVLIRIYISILPHDPDFWN